MRGLLSLLSGAVYGHARRRPRVNGEPRIHGAAARARRDGFCYASAPLD
jgi:hypothetical protein